MSGIVQFIHKFYVQKGAEVNFALRLKELREKKHLSQKQLAVELGVAVGSVGMWESAERIPPAKRLRVIAEYFNVSVDYLLGLIDDSEITTAAPMDDIYTAEEKLFIKKYRELNPACKKLVNNTLDTLVATSTPATEQKKKNS